MNQELRIAGIPFALSWLGEPSHWQLASDGISITAGPKTDWFIAPDGSETSTNAPALLGAHDGEFTFSARVQVDFAETYDAGALVLWQDAGTWAKLCFEYSPQAQPMVVSVVTRKRSDDCNSLVVDGTHVWLRVARVGRAYAFHASTDGRWWHFVRHFAFDPNATLRIGFEAQSPLGDACTAHFADVRFSDSALTELRDGS